MRRWILHLQPLRSKLGPAGNRCRICALSAQSQPTVIDLKQYIVAVPDFPQPGIIFRDIMPLLKAQFEPTIAALDDLLTADEWMQVDVVAGIESRGFILAAALALRRGKGFVPVRKQGKLPPPVSSLAYQLEYGTATLEMQPGSGRLIIVDDVIATGGTMTAAAKLCVRSGFQVSALIALIDLKLVPPLHCNGSALRAALIYD
jgi:adenine phosphoribosyltransferase